MANLKTEVDKLDIDKLVMLKKTDYDARKTDIEGKIPDITSLATKTALTTVENKIPDVSNLVKKTDYNTNITEIDNKLNNHNHDKSITTQEFNILAAARIAQASLITKTVLTEKLLQINQNINLLKMN